MNGVRKQHRPPATNAAVHSLVAAQAEGKPRRGNSSHTHVEQLHHILDQALLMNREGSFAPGHEKLRDCQQFILACQREISYGLQTSRISGTPTYLLKTLLLDCCAACEEAVAAGDLRLARALPAARSILDRADAHFGKAVRGRTRDSVNYNYFIRLLQEGVLWNNGLEEAVELHHGGVAPPSGSIKRWLSVIMSFLKGRFGDEPWRITVFEDMLGRRKGVASESLASDKPWRQWDRIQRKVERALMSNAARAK